MKYLPTFQLGELKTMDDVQLYELATEIREKIIETTSKNGGHLSSNLGVVELTIALHKVFDSPYDKIIFDVSHQIYSHKLLTGRYDDFDTLRQFQGISGFARKSESIHDAYEGGHSSTSLSAAIGMAVAKEGGANIGDIIVVIGDASITNGLAFEALNFLGANRNYKVIVIINDNDMSVSKNVGTLARTFNNIRVKRTKSVSRKTDTFVQSPFFRIKNSLKSFAYQKNIFDAMNFKYFQGIDGHNIKELTKYLNYAKNAKQSVIIHVKTTKGKGYSYAENDTKGSWHSVGPFDIATGLSQYKTELTCGEQIVEHLMILLPSNPSIRAITPAMTLGSGLEDLKHKFPGCFFDVGIAEESAVVMASAMAQNGLTPIVFMYATFLQRAYDQILHDVGRSNTPVVFCIDHAGIVANDGDTHQGIFDIAFLSTIPNITITMPMSTEECNGLLDMAITKEYGPFVIRYSKQLPSFAYHSFAYGTWTEILPLQNINIITYGSDVLGLYEALESAGLSDYVGLVNARFIKPYDKNMLAKMANQSKIVIIYEQVTYEGSLGANIMPLLSNCQLKHFVLHKTYLETGTIEQLKQLNEIDYVHVLSYIKKVKEC